MNVVVLYQSKYGFSKKYASWLSDEFNCACIEMSKAEDDIVKKADTIIFLGGTFAGKVEGIKYFKNMYYKIKEKKLVYCIVGLLGDSNKMTNEIKSFNFNEEMKDNVKIFWLKGGLDLNKLTFGHKIVTTMVSKSIKNKRSKTKEDQAMLDAFGTGIDLTDKNNLVDVLYYVGLDNKEE